MKMRKPRLTATEFMQYVKNSQIFDRVLSKVNMLSLENGTGHAEFTVHQEHTNSLGELHPSFVMALGDNISAYALSTHELGNNYHISINIKLLLYPPPAKLGDQIEVWAETLKPGPTVAFLEFIFKNKVSGQLLAKGNHNMFALHSKISEGDTKG